MLILKASDFLAGPVAIFFILRHRTLEGYRLYSHLATTYPSLAALKAFLDYFLSARAVVVEKKRIRRGSGGNYYYYKTDLASDGPMPFLDLSTHRSRSFAPSSV